MADSATTAAINAFNRASQLATGGSGMEARDSGQAAGAFAGMVREALQETVTSGKQAEAITAQAVAGKAELTEVVVAVNNAEIALQTVVSVRDRVLQAYQEIMRMPI